MSAVCEAAMADREDRPEWCGVHSHFSCVRCNEQEDVLENWQGAISQQLPASHYIKLMISFLTQCLKDSDEREVTSAQLRNFLSVVTVEQKIREDITQASYDNVTYNEVLVSLLSCLVDKEIKEVRLEYTEASSSRIKRLCSYIFHLLSHDVDSVPEVLLGNLTEITSDHIKLSRLILEKLASLNHRWTPVGITKYIALCVHTRAHVHMADIKKSVIDKLVLKAKAPSDYLAFVAALHEDIHDLLSVNQTAIGYTLYKECEVAKLLQIISAANTKSDTDAVECETKEEDKEKEKDVDRDVLDMFTIDRSSARPRDSDEEQVTQEMNETIEKTDEEKDDQKDEEDSDESGGIVQTFKYRGMKPPLQTNGEVSSADYESGAEEEQPSSESDTDDQAMVFDEENPVAEIVEENPVTEIVEENPVTEIVEENPVTEIVEENPVTEIVEENPVTEVVEDNPVTEIVEENPVTEIVEENPVTKLDAVEAASSMVNGDIDRSGSSDESAFSSADEQVSGEEDEPEDSGGGESCQLEGEQQADVPLWGGSSEESGSDGADGNNDSSNSVVKAEPLSPEYVARKAKLKLSKETVAMDDTVYQVGSDDSSHASSDQVLRMFTVTSPLLVSETDLTVEQRASLTTRDTKSPDELSELISECVQLVPPTDSSAAPTQGETTKVDCSSLNKTPSETSGKSTEMDDGSLSPKVTEVIKSPACVTESGPPPPAACVIDLLEPCQPVVVIEDSSASQDKVDVREITDTDMHSVTEVVDISESCDHSNTSSPLLIELPAINDSAQSTSAPLSPTPNSTTATPHLSPSSTMAHTPRTSRTPTSARRTPTSARHTPTSASHTPTLGKRTPTSASHTPTLGKRTPTSASHTPTLGKRTPTSASRTPTLGKRTPTSNNGTPASGRRRLKSASSPRSSNRDTVYGRDKEKTLEKLATDYMKKPAEPSKASHLPPPGSPAATAASLRRSSRKKSHSTAASKSAISSTTVSDVESDQSVKVGDDLSSFTKLKVKLQALSPEMKELTDTAVKAKHTTAGHSKKDVVISDTEGSMICESEPMQRHSTRRKLSVPLELHSPEVNEHVNTTVKLNKKTLSTRSKKAIVASDSESSLVSESEPIKRRSTRARKSAPIELVSDEEISQPGNQRVRKSTRSRASVNPPQLSDIKEQYVEDGDEEISVVGGNDEPKPNQPTKSGLATPIRACRTRHDSSDSNATSSGTYSLRKRQATPSSSNETSVTKLPKQSRPAESRSLRKRAK